MRVVRLVDEDEMLNLEMLKIESERVWEMLKFRRS